MAQTLTARRASEVRNWGQYVHGSSAVAPSRPVDSVVDELLAEVVAFPTPAPQAPKRVVLTRRGRLVRTLAVVFVLAVLVFAVVARGADGMGVTSSHTVVVGDRTSLVDVARVELPAMPVRDAVVVLQGYNDLPGTSLSVGQEIRVPHL